jgi:hypothetical protein
MFEILLFNSIILIYVLWTTIRTNRKIDLVGQLGALILTQVNTRYEVDDYPEEELVKAVGDWDSWDKE